jgi:hypothetical protein
MTYETIGLDEALSILSAESERLHHGTLGIYLAVLRRSGAAVCRELAGDERFCELIDRLVWQLEAQGAVLASLADAQDESSRGKRRRGNPSDN